MQPYHHVAINSPNIQFIGQIANYNEKKSLRHALQYETIYIHYFYNKAKHTHMLYKRNISIQLQNFRDKKKTSLLPSKNHCTIFFTNIRHNTFSKCITC